MRTVLDLAQLATCPARNAVVTLGVFDGVHRGHQVLLRRCCELARESGGQAVALTFDRHPRAVLTDNPPLTILSLSQRLGHMADLGVDLAYVLPFTTETAAISGERFVREFLVGQLQAKTVVLGSDAHFGHKRSGNIALLAEMAPAMGFDIVAVDLLSALGGATVSSTAIRQAVGAGDLETAQHMLGRPVSIEGIVVRGQALGRTIGFPTANLEPTHTLLPPRGVYAGTTQIGTTRLPVMLNIGSRPTVSGSGGQLSVEAHIVDFDGDLYGQTLSLELRAYLRAEQCFESLSALQAQLKRDLEHTRTWV